MVLITPFSWIEGERFKDNYLFKLLVGGVRIRERLFPNKNPQSKFSYLKKSKALRNEFTDWAWNNLHQSKNDFIYGDGGRHVVAFDSREWLREIETETLAMDGMVIDEGVLVEIVTPGTGNPVDDGEVGEVIVTTFNRDYPLIRFATGDMSAVLPGESPCGRTNMRIKGWLGRADQTTKIKGMFVRPEQVADFVQINKDILCLLYTSPSPRDATLSRMPSSA